MYTSSRIRRAILACLIVSLAALALAACGGSATGGRSTSTPAKPVISKDALGNPINIPSTTPQRIVSLTPADSEILAAVGADAHVVAVDNFTDYPAGMAAKPKISGADGKFNVERIVGLQPDLVLGAGGETPDVDKQLSDAHITVVDLPIATNLDDILNDITLVGQLVHADPAAARLDASLRARIEAVKQKVAALPPVSTYVELDYSTPGKPFVFGGGSFGDEVIRDAGGSNVFGANTSGQGFPQVSDESVIAANPAGDRADRRPTVRRHAASGVCARRAGRGSPPSRTSASTAWTPTSSAGLARASWTRWSGWRSCCIRRRSDRRGRRLKPRLGGRRPRSPPTRTLMRQCVHIYSYNSIRESGRD